MDLPSFKEGHISQIPALQLLQKLGYTYLTPERALAARGGGGGTTQVVLDSILRKQLHALNSIKVSSTRTSLFSDANIERGIQALKDLPMGDGFMASSEAVFNRITLGEALEQSIDGDKKTFTLPPPRSKRFSPARINMPGTISRPSKKRPSSPRPRTPWSSTCAVRNGCWTSPATSSSSTMGRRKSRVISNTSR